MRAATLTVSPISGELAALRCADVAEDHRPRVDADAHAQRRRAATLPLDVEPRETGLHGQRTAHRPRRMVRLGHRRAEIRHQSVAEVLVERAAEGEHLLDHARMEAFSVDHDGWAD